MAGLPIPDGSEVSSAFTGGCNPSQYRRRQKVYEFADVKTKKYLCMTRSKHNPLPPLVLDTIPLPPLDAPSYLVATSIRAMCSEKCHDDAPDRIDHQTHDSACRQRDHQPRQKVTVNEGELLNPEMRPTHAKTFLVDDLFYPLLMQSSNSIAKSSRNFTAPRPLSTG